MNQQIFYFLNNFALQYDRFDNLIVFCAQILPFFLIAILLIYHLGRLQFSRSKNSWRDEPLWKEVFRKIFIMLGSTFLIWGFSQIINYFYYSPRPFLILENINLLFTHGSGDSFPSGHATFFFTLAFMSYYYSPKWLYKLLLGGAIIVSFARVISGVHWPLDILGALILSSIGVFVIRKITPKRFK